MGAVGGARILEMVNENYTMGWIGASPFFTTIVKSSGLWTINIAPSDAAQAPARPWRVRRCLCMLFVHWARACEGSSVTKSAGGQES